MNAKSILDSIKNMMNEVVRTPAKAIPGIIMICSLAKRPGLSPIVSFGRIIQDLSNQGIPTGPLPDGSPNMLNKVIYSMLSETYRAFREDAYMQTSFGPGSFNIVATGANAGGPITVVGTNSNIANGYTAGY